ncbi:C6 zinc finger protein domain-containing protein, partial [Teratosphaeria destructans]
EPLVLARLRAAAHAHHTRTVPIVIGARRAPGAAQPPHPMEHGHHAYAPANGLTHGLPPPQPPPPAHHEPHTQHMTPVMDNHYAPYPAAPPPQQQPMYPQTYSGPVQGNQFQMQRKKQMRATQACEQCRARKQKCDEGNPCSFCKENNLTCQYRDTPPAKTDKNMEKLLNYMETHANGLTALTRKIEGLDHRLRQLERARVPAPQMTPVVESAPIPHEEALKRKSQLKDHRTPPHKLLLLWPSVSTLLRAADVRLTEGYVMEAEDRGILRLYTRGEGIDDHDGTQPGVPASPARSEESGGEFNAATPPEGLWGCGLPQTPQSEGRRSEPSWGGLKPDNTLDLDVSTINALYESYMRNIHIMHPFLDKARLRKLLDSFIRRYSPGQQKFRSTFAVVGTSSDGERPLKRQRSNGSTVMTHAAGGESFRSQLTERSPGNAIVYLVLALGKICLHKEPLPGAVPDNRLNANSVVSHHMSGNGPIGSSPVAASIKPSPSSPADAFLSKSTPATQPTPPAEGTLSYQSRSRRSSLDGVPGAGSRNLDVIPGLAYFAKACEILGDQGDGNDLVHAQMFLLAGLYKGQLARVKESMSWITMAGRAISNLLDRYKLYNTEWWRPYGGYGDVRKQWEKSHSLIKDKRSDLIVLASWTCLQLESDILAELPLPSSGILNVEKMLIFPHHVSEEESYDGLDHEAQKDEYDHIMLFYNAQMFLRKRLNLIHREMYGQDSLNEPLETVREMLRGHESILHDWRQGLLEKMKWRDSDEPPKDILNARLRAKYWGARYVVNRPFLDYALHILPYTEDNALVADVAKDVHGNARDEAEIHMFEAIEGMGHQAIWEAAKRCIDAAMYSTVAFDGVDPRLIVTNIHGTAHAQFGNMLVLSATYYNKALSPLVDKERFRKLLERTIRFLRKLAPISPTCRIDCSILESIQKKLFGLPSDTKHVYHNEGITEARSATNSFSATT